MKKKTRSLVLLMMQSRPDSALPCYHRSLPCFAMCCCYVLSLLCHWPITCWLAVLSRCLIYSITCYQIDFLQIHTHSYIHIYIYTHTQEPISCIAGVICDPPSPYFFAFIYLVCATSHTKCISHFLHNF